MVKKASNLKNALTKAGFDKLSKDWNRVFVIFFDESNNSRIKESLKEEQTKACIEILQGTLEHRSYDDIKF